MQIAALGICRVGSLHAGRKSEESELKRTRVASTLPSATGTQVRKRWTELLALSYATRRVTRQEIEPGVHAVVVPPIYGHDRRQSMLDADVRAVMSQVPAMAMGVRLALDRIDEFDLALRRDYRRWLGKHGQDIAEGRARATALVDLAYLEAALLDRLWQAEVLVDFNSPLAFFRRGGLSDYANVMVAVAAMVFEGRSLAETADRLARGVLSRLGLYADTFLKLSKLYTEAVWRIEKDTFVMEVPATGFSLSLQYWALRDGPEETRRTLEAWRQRIEALLLQAVSQRDRVFPRSYAA
jgi:hypothetical protein